MIKYATAAAALFALASPLAAEPADLGWDLVEGLTTEVGQRLAGTEAEARARDWGLARLRALGFANVRIETYQMPVWERGLESGELLTPFPQKLALTALGNSGATPAAGLTGELIAFASYDAFKAAPAALVRGKIVYISHAMRAAQDGSSYGFYGVLRRQGPNLAAQRGAAALLIRSIGTDSHRAPHTGVTNFDAGVAPIPAAAVSNPDADLIERVVARGRAVSLKLLLTPRFTGTKTSGNVIAEVPGSDPAAGLVVIGGHLDSWDLATGAIDDAAGIAITTAAAHAMLAAPKPRRTIRVVWWGAEEVGGFGGDAYHAAHQAEPHALVAESDFGADRVWRLDLGLPASAKALGERLSVALAPLGITTSRQPAGGGADTEHFVKQGAAVVDLQQDGSRYFDLHHTPDDTLDKIDRAQLAQNVKAWTVLLDLAANAPEDLLVPKK